MLLLLLLPLPPYRVPSLRYNCQKERSIREKEGGGGRMDEMRRDDQKDRGKTEKEGN